MLTSSKHQFQQVSTVKEIMCLNKNGSLCLRHQTSQCVILMQSSWNQVERFETSQAKAEVLEVLEKSSLFG
ncbi:hypothetical protein OUZ56_030257 [Daphnia magna]|uniref:Uncharacterized protein n=1 Tax=Daphnia magna TaxID=35525 RepID=A0ABQ9ZQS2_9CRUS|nr:hypothetical protein OUZ56_030257 [Daphnia magna]